MKTTKTIALAGGDLRQAYLAEQLARDGHRVLVYALEGGMEVTGGARAGTTGELAGAQWLILPLPVCSGPDILHTPLSPHTHSLTALLDHLPQDCVVLGGRPDDDTLALLQDRGLTLLDYFAREEVVVANALATAEGAVLLALERLPVTICGLEVLVLGYGRVARHTARCFAALGARVSVGARSPVQRTWAGTEGLRPLPLGGLGGRWELVINTIPAPVLDRAALSMLDGSPLILDLASLPGGVDAEAARTLGLEVLRAPGLPGKTSPASAAGYLRRGIYNMLCQREG